MSPQIFYFVSMIPISDTLFPNRFLLWVCDTNFQHFYAPSNFLLWVHDITIFGTFMPSQTFYFESLKPTSDTLCPLRFFYFGSGIPISDTFILLHIFYVGLWYHFLTLCVPSDFLGGFVIPIFHTLCPLRFFLKYYCVTVTEFILHSNTQNVFSAAIILGTLTNNGTLGAAESFNYKVQVFLNSIVYMRVNILLWKKVILKLFFVNTLNI